MREATATAILAGIKVADNDGNTFTFEDVYIDHRDVIAKLMNHDNEPDLANEAVVMVHDAISDLVDRVLE